MDRHCLECTSRLLGIDLQEDDVELSLTEEVCDGCLKVKPFVLDVKEEALPLPG